MKFFHETFSSLKIRNYRLYFIGQAVSISGNWMQTVAQSWLVLELTGSGTALGLVLALQYLPSLFLAPFAGLVADRMEKRKLLIFTQTAFALIAFLLGLLSVLGLVKIWMVYIFALLFGLINVFDNVTRQTFVVEMVSEKNLPNAIALNSTEFNVARVFGPAIAGILIASIGTGFCFLFNAFSYITVLLALFAMKKDDLHKVPRAEVKKGQLREGLKYVKERPVLKDTLIMMAIVGTFTYEFSVSLPLLAQFVFEKGASAYALLTSSMGIGAVFAGILVAAKKERHFSSLGPQAFLFGLFVLATALAPNIYFAFFALIAVGFMSVYFTSLGNVVLQLNTSPKMRGRVMSLWTIAFLGSTPIGGPIIGWVGEYLGARWSLIFGAAAAFVAALIGLKRLKKEN